MSNRALIIGGGIAGLASAIRLRSKGFEVEIFEANNEVGGKLGEITLNGFRWDSGPSLFTMPQMLDELFQLHGREMEAYIPYRKKDTICNYFWEDGKRFSMSADLEKCYSSIADEFGEDLAKVRKYFERSLLKYQLTAPVFLESSLHKASTYFQKSTFRALSKLTSLDLTKNLHQLNAESFSNPKLVQLLDRFATYNGSSPYRSPGIMSLIPSLEMHYGTYFPSKGMRSIPDGLHKLAEEVGVKIHLNREVKEILLENNQAAGILCNDGKEIKGDVVVSNMDSYFTYHKLLSSKVKPHKSTRSERSSSALIFYWGIEKEFTELDLHNIFFSDNYENEFRDLFERKTLNDDPTIYINISSKEKTDDAPQGSENWFVMVNAPTNEGQDWGLLREKIRANVLVKLKRILGVSIAPLIKAERVMDPVKIEQNTKSFQGSLYGTSSNDWNSAFLRHPNHSKSIPHLYFVGGTVHPGGGIPLCLQSAKVASNMIAS